MGFWKSVPEKREGFSDILRAVIRPDAVSEYQAVNIPAIIACIDFISGKIASLPIKLYKEKGNGMTNEIEGDYRLRLLNDETGDLLDSFQWKSAIIRDYFIHGAGYSYVNWQGTRIESLNYIENKSVSVNLNSDPIFKSAQYFVNGQKYNDFEILGLLRNSKNGVEGNGIIRTNPLLLSVFYNTMKLENKNAKAGYKKGFLESESKLNEEAIESLKNSWKRLYEENEENVIVLNKGVKFCEASNTSVEMQLNENKKTNSAEICKLFGISPNVFEGKATVDDYKSSIKLGVMPILSAFKSVLNRYLLLESEKKDNYYFEFDITEMLKADTYERYKAYEIALKNSFMQIEEVRFKEDLKPLGLEFLKLGLQDVFYNPETKDVYTPNTNKTTKLNGDENIEN